MAYMQLDRPVQFLKGVGPRRAEALKKLRIGTAHDLLHHLPRRYDDASTILPIATLKVGMDVTARGHVRSKGVLPTRSGLRIFQVVLQDDSGYITCSWPGQPWLDRKIQEGDELLVTGPVKHFHGRQIHPREFTLIARAGRSDAEGTGEREREGGTRVRGGPGPGSGGDGRREAPGGGRGGRAGGFSAPGGSATEEGAVYVSYPSTDELPQWVVRDILTRNLDWMLAQIPEEEYLSPEERRALGLPELSEALRRLHRPRSAQEPEFGRRRLAFDEFFFLQLVQAIARHRETEVESGIVFTRTNEFIRPLHEALPFRLTGAQARVLREIFQDMTSPRRMNRFLQGDVGSGKTLVALFAMLLAAESGYQAVMMAPTELLAEQHALRVREFLAMADLDLEVVFVSGSLNAKARREALAALGEGGEGVIGIGTHALIQEGVDFRDLGLVIVDEQHRFGVRQRMALARAGAGGSDPDVLVMSATPIPRSLALALYGDLDLSLLDEIPPGRTPIETRLYFPGQRREVYARVKDELEKGHQGYIVYPLVAESEKLELRAAAQERDRLAQEVFSDYRLGLLHGQMSAEEKDAVMRSFRAGELDLLVATSIVEVGIDVPNATVMLIEHAERFGLSQLHQLRGRVGRGTAPSICLLVAEAGEASLERLRVFRDTRDGFRIARADLMIRGQGDLFGSQQHGRDPLLRFADLGLDEELLDAAREMARRIVAEDPDLSSPAHAKIRDLLAWRHGERLKMWKVG